jgi:aminomethyltransferase
MRVRMSEELLRTALHGEHVARGGRMVPFAGWEMPVMYTGIAEEHVHTRTACSVFDVSHMGRLRLTGADAGTLLDRVCTRNLKGAEPGRCYYSHICREDGGILDDVIVSRYEDRWGVVCNASNREKIVSWLAGHAEGRDVHMLDETRTTVMLALQGPKTIELAGQIAGEDFVSLKRYRFRVASLFGSAITVARTGYTGEDGFEVIFPSSLVGVFVPYILGTVDEPHAVIRPAGLGARDTLRLEAGMPLYGHELTEDVDSLSAGQAWCVDLSKEFIGAPAMREVEAKGIPRRLVGLELEGRRIARQHAKVLADGREIGEVTSGTLSPTLGKSIAMAYVPAGCSEPGRAVEVDLGRQRATAHVTPLPFYRRAKG